MRQEALIALIFSTGPEGPKFTGYAIDALMLHVLAILNDYGEQMFTGVSVLKELQSRGDNEAARIVQSLSRDRKWKQTFR